LGTGARVQELRRFEAKHFRPENNRLVLPPSQVKGKRSYRIIYLTECAKEIVAWLGGPRDRCS
jgi:hypothetical protein